MVMEYTRLKKIHILFHIVFGIGGNHKFHGIILEGKYDYIHL
jgi:hypothetical protein